jgi:NAD(P)-dependent dehydrogenase (short-subunit alcohol dehydrogenase family)
MCASRKLPAEEDPQVQYTLGDLGTEKGCADIVADTVERLGDIEILVCNHGIGSAHERVVWEQSLADWKESIHVNLDGPFYLSRLVLPGMIKKKYGRAVYTSSTAACVAEQAGSAYNSSKSGLLGLMRSVATDGGAYGITANAVLPGWVRTEMAERSARHEARDRGISPEQVWEERAALYPPGRVATPEEVAEMIAFLASEESSGVSGESIRVALGSVW